VDECKPLGSGAPRAAADGAGAEQGLTLLPVSAQLELALPISAQLKLTLYPM